MREQGNREDDSIKAVFMRGRGVWLVLCAASLLALAQPIQAASFDCAKAKTDVEKLICADAELSKLDEDMAVAYATALKIVGKAAIIRRQQAQWLKVRNNCTDALCVKDQYAVRIQMLVDAAQADIPMGPRSRMTARVVDQPDLGSNAGWDFVLHPGAGVEDWLEDADDPMCQQIKDHMNKVARKWDLKPTPRNRCASAVGLAPFLSEPPWTELDPKEHEELIMRLMWFSQDPYGYFKIRPQATGWDENHFRKRARDFIEKGGRLQHWRARMIESLYFPPDSHHKPLPPGAQDVIQLRHTYNTREQERKTLGCKLPNWSGQVFLVTADLTEPLRHLDRMGSLYLYEGDPVLIADSDEISVRSPYRSRSSHSCRLTYPNHTSEDIEKVK